MSKTTEASGLEVSDLLRAGAEDYRRKHPLSAEQAKVLWRLTACRTATLGGHLDSCDGCGYQRISYNSCRDRHCPKCQAGKRAAWLESRLERLLPINYFHVVFTIPDLLNPLMLKNQRRLYGLLFEAASGSVLTLAADPKRLGAQVGMTAILHTWGQNLFYHPHLHCVVTGGGLTPDGQRWKSTAEDYFLPVKVLAKLFRGKFLASLKQAYDGGELQLEGSVASLKSPHEFGRLLNQLYQRSWVVYAKRPFGGAEQVFRYLGRYSHRVAISNNRLLAMEEDRVYFQYKDYAHGNAKRVMSLTVEEFIRRFLLHVLPKGFVRIRHYGVLASGNVETKLARCRQLLEESPSDSNKRSPSWVEDLLQESEEGTPHCPDCQRPLRRMGLVVRWRHGLTLDPVGSSPHGDESDERIDTS